MGVLKWKGVELIFNCVDYCFLNFMSLTFCEIFPNLYCFITLQIYIFTVSKVILTL